MFNKKDTKISIHDYDVMTMVHMTVDRRSIAISKSIVDLVTEWRVRAPPPQLSPQLNPPPHVDAAIVRPGGVLHRHEATDVRLRFTFCGAGMQ